MGPQGIPGPAGVTTSQIITEESDAVDDGTSRIYLQARCPPGEKILGGGYNHGMSFGGSAEQQSAFDIIENRPYRVPGGIDMWIVTALNVRGIAREAGDVSAFAICTDTP